MRKVRVFLAAGLFAGAAHAEFWDGNKLLDRLTSSVVVDRVQALGYIMGVSDTMQTINHCPPPNVQAGQMEDMVRNYLNNTPAVRHFSADGIVLQVLKTAFPCSRGRGNV